MLGNQVPRRTPRQSTGLVNKRIGPLGSRKNEDLNLGPSTLTNNFFIWHPAPAEVGTGFLGTCWPAGVAESVSSRIDPVTNPISKIKVEGIEGDTRHTSVASITTYTHLYKHQHI